MVDSQKKDVEIKITTSSVRGQDINYVEIMVYFSSLLLAQITGTEKRFLMTCDPPGDDGKYHLKIDVDDGREIFCVEGINEKECATNLLAEIMTRYNFIKTSKGFREDPGHKTC